MIHKSDLKLPNRSRVRDLVTVLALFGPLLGILVTADAFAQNSGTSRSVQPKSTSAGVYKKTSAPKAKFTQISQIVQSYFKQVPHHKEGYLIVREEAQKAFEALQKEGIVVSNQESILEKTLTKKNFLAKTLRKGRSGREFMSHISKYPLAYDQLDRLARDSVGRRTVIDLVRGPGGYKMLQYMSKGKTGKNLGKMLSSDQSGGDFNKPTGRIYTAEQLLKAIKSSNSPEK